DERALTESGSGSFSDDSGWIVTYTTSGITGWKFVNVTKKSILLQGLNRIKMIVAAVSALYVAIAIILSVYISQRLYRPFKSVIAYISGASPAAGASAADGPAPEAALRAVDEA